MLLSGGPRAEPIFQFHTLTRDDGLASSVVYDVTQDRTGFIWFATEDGVQKFDGVELTTYRQNRNNPHSLSNNIARKLLLDSKGTLWIGTQNGVNVYQRELDRFIRITAESHGLAGNQIRELFQSRDGDIWVGTTTGLSRIDPNTYKVTSYGQYSVRAIVEDEFKQLWIGTLGDGLFQFDRVSNEFIAVSKAQGNADFDIQHSMIIDLFEDSFGRLLVATWGSGVWELDRESRTLTHLALPLPDNSVRQIYQDEAGQLWFATRKGVFVYDSVQKKVREIHENKWTKASLKSENIWCIFQSRDNTIWVGTYGGGVSRHFPSSRRFETYSKRANARHGLIDPVVYALYEDDDGKIWIGTESGYLALFDPLSRQFKHYLGADESALTKGQLISSISRLDSKQLIIGTDSDLLLYDLDKRQLKSISASLGQARTNIRFIEKIRDGEYWLGIRNLGLRKLIIRGGNYQLLTPENVPSIEDINAFYAEQDFIYVAGTNSGVWKIRLGPDEALLNSELLPHSKNLGVHDVTKDWAGRLWIGTWSNGIRILQSATSFHDLNETTGMPSSSVYQIIADATSHKIWATTNNGMVSINPKNFKITSFSYWDGLQDNEFNSPGIRARNGYLYFGGVNGFTRFYPNILEQSLFVLPPEVISLSIANREVIPGESNVLSKAMSETESLVLQYEQTPFSFEFTSPQFVKPKQLEFRYRLVGLSEKWLPAPKGIRHATYTNISPGDYTFELQVKGDGNWIESSRKINIQVVPPWWQTNLARVMYLTFILLVIWFVVRHFQIKRENERRVAAQIAESESRLKLALWGSGFEVWDWDIVTGKVKRSHENDYIKIECKYLSRNLTQLASYVHPNDLDMVKEALARHLAGMTEYFEATYRVKKSSKKWQWIQDRGKVVARDDNGNATRMSGTQRDITDIRQREEQYAIQGKAFRSTSDGVWIRDHEWRLLDCNPAYERITGFSLDEQIGEVLTFAKHERQEPDIMQRIHLAIEEKGSWQGEVWSERKNGEIYPQNLSIDVIKDEKGDVKYFVGVFTDITFKKRAEQEFRKLANYDTMTGLPNRTCLADRLKQSLENARRREEKLAVFLIDIDNFKRINESMGLSVGDELIKRIAELLVNCNREGDTVARYGGDEFIIIREDVESSSQVASFAEMILAELNQPIVLRGEKISLSFSIGIALYPNDGKTPDTLLRNADQAMHEAKKNILNSYKFYRVELFEKAKKMLVLENALRDAISTDQLALYYQPKVDLSSGQIVGVEALARWKHPTLGVVSPAEFISVAEQTGLIVPLGKSLLQKAIVQTKEWVDAGIMRGKTSVNLSPNQIWQGNLIADIDHIFNHTHLDTKYIELEVTESVLVEDVEVTRKKLQALRERGLSLALDDFGTGYSSISILKHLPFNVLKIDKSFIKNVTKDDSSDRVVKAIIDMARALQLEVVVEGVENKKQCEYLWLNRAHIVQGYFFCMPMPAHLMTEFFNNKWNPDDYLNGMSGKITPLT